MKLTDKKVFPVFEDFPLKSLCVIMTSYVSLIKWKYMQNWKDSYYKTDTFKFFFFFLQTFLSASKVNA